MHLQVLGENIGGDVGIDDAIAFPAEDDIAVDVSLTIARGVLGMGTNVAFSTHVYFYFFRVGDRN